MPIYVNSSDKNVVVRAGHGDLVIGIAGNEVVITPSDSIGVIGERTDIYVGKSTAELPPGVRLVFDAEASVRVLKTFLDELLRTRFGNSASDSELIPTESGQAPE